MKDLKKIQEFFSKPINEIGDKTAGSYKIIDPYGSKEDENKKEDEDEMDKEKESTDSKNVVKYTFITDSGLNYVVEFAISEDGLGANVDFYVKSDVKGNEFTQMFNKGELFKVMATITTVIEKFLSTREDIETLYIDPAEAFEDDERRSNLYKKYIEKNLNTKKYSVSSPWGGTIAIERNENINENQNDPIDSIKMDVPLFLRSLEYAREDAKDDMDLHDFTEKAIQGTKQKGTLSMADYDDLTRQKIREIIQQVLSEQKKTKRDRCLRIADRKYDKPSAYKSGAVVRCRKGDIWKDLKEEILSSLVSIEPYNDPDDEYAQDLDAYLKDDNINWEKESYITLLNPNDVEPSEWNFLSDDPNNPKSVKMSKKDPKKFPPILVVKKGENKYEAIDGIHRTYAFRLNNNMIPAIVITPKLEQGLSTNDTQMVNFMFNKYKDTNIPTPVKINNLKEEKEVNIQDLAYQQNPGLFDKGIKSALNRLPSYLKARYKWSGPKDRNEFFDFIENIKGEIKRVPLSSIKPSQFGKDYKNASSEHQAKEFQKILDGEKQSQDHRKEDFYPIVVNKKDNTIIDGNHRHYALSTINSPYAVVLYVDVPEQYLKEDESLHKWFKRSGTPGKEGGWVDCNAPIRKDGKITGYKSCGRKKGEKRAKYPSCRPTPAKCKDKGKGKTWGKTK